MVCMYCGGKTQVFNSRPQKKQNSTWRRRQCKSCKAVFTSVETMDLSGSLLVASNAKRSEPFSRDKLLLSVYDSLKHRKTAANDATALTNTIVGKLMSENSDAVIAKALITDVTKDILKRFDTVAAVHYQAYYQ